MGIVILGLILFLIGFFSGKSQSPLAPFKRFIKLGGVLVFLIGILMASVKIINPGTVGVQILFGEIKNTILYEGLNFINPFVDVTKINVQTQNYTMSSVVDEGQKAGDDAIHVLSQDGLEVALDLTILYRVMATEAPAVYRKIGVDFQDKVIRPICRTRIRESAVYFAAIDLYSTKREAFETRIREMIFKDFQERGFVLEQLLVRSINLPKSVKESIERKITADQDAQRMKFVLEKEQQEAERKRVEAKGVADAQKIVSSGLSDKLLQFEMIKVQKELVNSTNSKIIVLGNSKGGVPIIVNDDGKK